MKKTQAIFVRLAVKVRVGLVDSINGVLILALTLAPVPLDAWADATGTTAVINSLGNATSTIMGAFQTPGVSGPANRDSPALRALAQCDLTSGAVLAPVVETASYAASALSKSNAADSELAALTDVCKNNTDILPLLKSKTAACSGAPNLVYEPKSCESYVQVSGAVSSNKNEDPDGKILKDLFNRDLNMATCAARFAAYRQKCTSPGLDEIEKRAHLLDCRMKAMNAYQAELIKEASDEMNAVNTVYETQLLPVEKDIVNQEEAIATLLNGDPSKGGASLEFGGLLNLQKEIKQQVAAAELGGRQAEQEIRDYESEQRIAENEPKDEGLAATRSCIDGEGSGVVRCSPVDNNGVQATTQKNCNAMEALKSWVAFESTKNKNGQSLRGNTDKIAPNLAMVENIVNEITRGMGSYNDVKGNPATAGAPALAAPTSTVEVDSFDKFRQRYADDLATASRKMNLNIEAKFNQLVNRCFQQGETRSRIVKNSEAYRKKMKDMAGKRETITTKLKQANVNAEDVFRLAAKAMGASQVAFPPCTAAAGNELSGMSSCFNARIKNLESLKNGTDNLAFKGGLPSGLRFVPGSKPPMPWVKPIALSGGLDNWVTQLSRAQEGLKQTRKASREYRESWVSQQNQALKTKMAARAEVLAGLQQRMLGEQESKIAELMSAAGVTSSSFAGLERRTPAQGDGLAGQERELPGGGREVGPMKVGGNMADEFAKLMGGTLIDFSNPRSVADLRAAIVDKKTADKTARGEAAKEAAMALKNFKDTESSLTGARACGAYVNKGAVTGTSDVSLTECSNCTQQLEACFGKISENSEEVKNYKDKLEAYNTYQQCIKDNPDKVGCSYAAKPSEPTVGNLTLTSAQALNAQLQSILELAERAAQATGPYSKATAASDLSAGLNGLSLSGAPRQCNQIKNTCNKCSTEVKTGRARQPWDASPAGATKGES